MAMELAGEQLVIDDKMMKAYCADITPAGAIGKWTDAGLARAIREGIRPDGSLIGPPMPFGLYKDLSDTDLAATIAYLRTLPPLPAANRDQEAVARVAVTVISQRSVPTAVGTPAKRKCAANARI